MILDNKDKTIYKCGIWGIGVVAYKINIQLSFYEYGIDNVKIVNEYQIEICF